VGRIAAVRGVAQVFSASPSAHPVGDETPEVPVVPKPFPFAASVLAVLLLALAPAAASAATTLRPGDEGEAVAVLQRALDVRADGVYGGATTGAVRRQQRRRDLKADGIARPSGQRTPGIEDDVERAAAAAAPAAPAPPQDDSPAGVLARIAECESGGDPTAVSRDGRYRGKYQFLRETWESLGGTGDPAAAPEAEQDRLALALYEREGITPWPHCGRQATGGERRAADRRPSREQEPKRRPRRDTSGTGGSQAG